jgi:hypothetical protein
MQSPNFDELTKALAASTSRRHALRTIVTTAVGGLFGLTSISTVFGKNSPCHRNGTACSANRKCCSGYCNPQKKCAAPPCVAAGGDCSTVDNCCSGLCCGVICCGSGETCLNNTTCCTAAGQPVGGALFNPLENCDAISDSDKSARCDLFYGNSSFGCCSGHATYSGNCNNVGDGSTFTCVCT